MSTVAWVAIAAIIIQSINSWGQFWLKERSEKKKALAAANPATNQPNPRRSIERDSSFKGFLSRRWPGFTLEWLASWFSVTVLLDLGKVGISTMPTGRLIVVQAVALLSFALFLAFFRPLRS